MKKADKKPQKNHFFEKMSTAVSKFTGSTGAFVCAMGVIVLWLVTGPIFQYSDTWQLVINTGTTIITFLMVFLIQRSQNKESLAMQVKLNELIASSKDASNRLVDIEDLSEDEIMILQKFYTELAKKSKKDSDLRQSHSLEEAQDVHEQKLKDKSKD